jgi:hypothetical protein
MIDDGQSKAHDQAPPENNCGKTEMMTLRLLTAALLATASTAAYAASSTKTYTFADGNGVPYCDGIQLAQTGDFDSGDIFGISCKEIYYGLGFKAKLPGAPAATWNFIYTDPTQPTTQFLVALDERSLQWAGYYESIEYGIALTEFNSGLLLKGQQGTRSGGPSVTTQLRAHALLAPHRK